MGYHEYVHGAYYGLKYQASQKRYLVTVLGLRLPLGCFPQIRKKPGGTHFFHTENEFLKRCEIAVGSMVSRAHQLVAIAAAVRDILRGWPSTMWRSAHRCAASMVDPCDCAPTFKNSDQECYARRAHAPLIVHHPDST